MNDSNQIFRVGRLALQLQQLPTDKDRVALLEAECSISPDRAEVAALAWLYLAGGRDSPLRKRLKVSIFR